MPRSQLKDLFGCTDKVILRVLEENNVEIRRAINPGGPKSSKFGIKENYFELNNQSHNSAYILGVLASDGCVASKENQIYIEVQRADKEWIEAINRELGNERAVKDYENYSKNYLNSKLYFFSKKIKQDLKQYNIIPNKTNYDNDFFQNIDPKYYLDYIRGHFDGDGSIKWTNGSLTWQIDSSSSKTLKHMQEILTNYGIETKIVLKNDNSIVNIPMYRIYFYGYEKGLKLFNLLYLSSSNPIKLDRKYNHFIELLLKYKTHETPDLLLLDIKD